MNFRSVANRFHMLRFNFDKAAGALRALNVGFVSKTNFSMQASPGVNLSEDEVKTCDDFIEQQKILEKRRDEVCYLELPYTVERLSRYFDALPSAIERGAAARELIFTARELRRIARRATDIQERDLEDHVGSKTSGI